MEEAKRKGTGRGEGEKRRRERSRGKADKGGENIFRIVRIVRKSDVRKVREFSVVLYKVTSFLPCLDKSAVWGGSWEWP